MLQGHGDYSELVDEKEFFEVSKKSTNIVCHFYRDGAERCKIVDKHLKILAAKHLEAKFCKVNAEKCPFLTQRLRIKVIPSIALIKDSKTRDYIVGFTDLGNCDDFSTGNENLITILSNFWTNIRLNFRNDGMENCTKWSYRLCRRSP